jgi:hypothetical protein
MLPVEWIWEERNRTRVLLLSVATASAIALVDWLTKPHVSLGFLYLFPIILAAGFLPRWVIGLLGAAGATLSALFSSLDTSFVRLGLETIGRYSPTILPPMRCNAILVDSERFQFKSFLSKLPTIPLMERELPEFAKYFTGH